MIDKGYRSFCISHHIFHLELHKMVWFLALLEVVFLFLEFIITCINDSVCFSFKISKIIKRICEQMLLHLLHSLLINESEQYFCFFFSICLDCWLFVWFYHSSFSKYLSTHNIYFLHQLELFCLVTNHHLIIHFLAYSFVLGPTLSPFLTRKEKAYLSTDHFQSGVLYYDAC